MTMHAGRLAALAVGLAVLLVSGTGLTASAVVDEGPPPEPDNGISAKNLNDSVRVYRPDAVRVFTLDGAVISLGDDVEHQGETAVISLSTDLLFEPNSWDLPASAPSGIAELVTDVPNGATVQVTGHTDSRPTIGQDFDNQELSQNRAEAVATALEQERPDLDLEVSGVGDTEPAVVEDPEDPDTYAANRRVEISYEG